jgi:hypothetical protein
VNLRPGRNILFIAAGVGVAAGGAGLLLEL